MTERTVNAERMEQVIEVFGSLDENIRKIEDAFHVHVVNRGEELKIQGEEENADRGVQSGNDDKIGHMAQDVVCVTAKGKPIKAKTLGQQRYLRAIEKHTITLGVGPAGTGKTYLAVAVAVAAFRAKTVNRIILTRPAVEAGERLGFLPGDLQNKVDPYLRPL